MRLLKPTCSFFFFGVLTGRMAFRTGFRGVFDGVGGPCMIEAGRLTLPGMLADRGYATALFGKWHVGMTFFDAEGEPIIANGLAAVRRIDYSRPVPDGPVHRGFARFFGTVSCPTTDWLYAYMEGDRIPVRYSSAAPMMFDGLKPKWANSLGRGRKICVEMYPSGA
jgi:arylsulfatase A